MDKLKKNIDQLVSGKVLKDIHKIVSEEEVKEKKEKQWAMFLVGLILLVVIVLSVLNYII